MSLLHENRIWVGRAGQIGPTLLKDVGESFVNDPPTPVRKFLAHLISNIAGGSALSYGARPTDYLRAVRR
jgi:hypothetical protein